jgi:glycosyltransferase involved in cell wall biosynthesis
MKVLVLYTALTGYITACMSAFRDITGGTLLTYAWPTKRESPFSAAIMANLGDVRSRVQCDPAAIIEQGKRFAPDAVLVSGWIDQGYMQAARHFRRLGIPVIAGCDTQWKGSLRQRVASIIAPAYLHSAFDVLWVPGERQAVFARHLGYTGNRCWEGYYACDWQQFSTHRIAAPDATERLSFLFVGRYVPEKAIATLAAAYERYRDMVDQPWPLVCAGVGPERDALVAAGAIDRGFLQPAELPALMAGSSAFILPSMQEPWGVVLHEAAAAGLPLIASRACGAAVHLLRDGYNGCSFATGDSVSLATAMTRIHTAPAAKRISMGEASRSLSQQFTPQIWARQLRNGIERLKAKAHLPPR